MNDGRMEYIADAALLRTGIDIIEIPRIRRSLENPLFLRRFFGPNERAWLKSRGYPAGSVAANFCAKEAFSKAMGTGIRGFSFHEVELLRDSLGKPYLHLTGKALELAKHRRLRFEVSVSHTRHYAVAHIISWIHPDKI